MSVVIVIVIFMPGLAYAAFVVKRKSEVDQQEYDEAIQTDRTDKPKKQAIIEVVEKEDIETGPINYEPNGLT